MIKNNMYQVILVSLFFSLQVHALIAIKAPPKIKARIEKWLSKINKYKVGHETLKAILKSRHMLTIEHFRSARQSAGKTGAPATRNLINGVGEDVYIHFDGTIPERGSHYTYDYNGEKLIFSAVVNLYHELSHAKHMICGDWNYAYSEQQAIDDENKLREEQYLLGEVKTNRLRYNIIGCSYEEDEQECLDFFEDD